MFPNVPLAIGHKRVFDSVFPPAPLSSISPTPESTPTLGFTSPGQSFGGGIAEKTTPRNQWQQSEQQLPEADSPPEQITWDRAWHTATTYLSIPDKGFSLSLENDEPNDDNLDEETLIKRWAKEPPSQFVSDNIFYVAADASPGRERRIGLLECDMQEWYMNETRRHFLCNFRDGLVKILKAEPSGGVLQRLVRYLRLAQNIYFIPFVKHISPLLDPTVQDNAFAKLQRNVHAIISYSFPEADISSLLTEELTTECLVILGIPHHRGDDEEESNLPDEDDMDLDQKYTAAYSEWRKEPSRERRLNMMAEGEDAQMTEARDRLLHLLEGIQNVGLGGSRAQRVFADVMNKMMTEFVTSTYASEWASPSFAAEHLQQWIEDVFTQLVIHVLHVLKFTDGEAPQPEEELDVTLSDVEKWQEIGMARLGALRIGELFDIIVEWDSSKGAIEDLKQYILNPATRYLLTTSFLSSVGSRLLHPGASTVEILQIYISIIRTFAHLDPRGVLLDRVAKPIRRYLKDREDTVKVIVNGLLSEDSEGDDQDATAEIERLPELAQELSDAHKLALRDDAADLDWNDMNWIPDPIDAAPDYKKSKTDVVGSLISLFDTKEVFVKELQKTLSDRLLKKNKDYEQEISVLELLKIRFGDSSLQACEVMLRDIIDSKRVDSFIRAEQNLGTKGGEAGEEMESHEDAPELHAKILSRLYWPTIQDMAFKIPDQVDSLQSKYSSGFESLKPARKLTWLNGLGKVTVELDLEDRVFKDEVTTWQATVIYAFQSPTPTSSTQGVIKSVQELAEQLDISVSLVRSACFFWLSKQVLVEVQPDTFRVLETLPEDSEKVSENIIGHKPAASPGARHGPGGASSAAPGHQNTAAAAAAAVAAQEAAAKESADAAAMAQLDLYWQFIVGMLTNQGAMPLQRIIMMLKMVVPGGFPFSSEELKEFLGQKVAQGKLEMAGGGNYKIVK